MKTGGHKHSPEAREKIRQAALRQWQDPEVRERMLQAERRRFARPEEREKIRQANLGNKSALGCKRSPETREKMRQARLRRVFPQKMTDIERILCAEFKKRRLKFEMHKTMFGRWQPDFVFESARLIVEADGDYWHSLPDIKERGGRFDKVAHDAGWSVWRFGGKEIKMHPIACARAVARFVRDHGG